MAVLEPTWSEGSQRGFAFSTIACNHVASFFRRWLLWPVDIVVSVSAFPQNSELASSIAAFGGRHRAEEPPGRCFVMRPMEHEPHSAYRSCTQQSRSDLPGRTGLNERLGERIDLIIAATVKRSRGDAIGHDLTPEEREGRQRDS
jgi:hypothetical protein